MRRLVFALCLPVVLGVVTGWGCLAPDSGTAGTGGSAGGRAGTGGGSSPPVGAAPDAGGPGGGQGTTTSPASGGATGGSGESPRTGGTSGATGGRVGGATGGSNGSGGRATAGTTGTGANATGGRVGTGGSGTGGTMSNVMQPPPITNGSPGWASRYWDCCKPACGWKANLRTGNPMTSCNQQNQSLSSADVKNACDGGGGGAFMCWNASPWSVSDTLSYGFVAASAGNYVCGRCFQLQFTGSGHSGSNPGASSLNGKSMIVQVINNGGVAGDQMDILIPGGGVGALNACSTQWGNVNLGAQFGGFFLACKNDKACTQQMCQAAFAGKPELQAGCDWFLGWFNGADNPNFVFKQVSCPSAITQKSGLTDPG